MGIEEDKLIAEAFGVKPTRMECTTLVGSVSTDGYPACSTEDNAVWKVIELIEDRFPNVSFSYSIFRSREKGVSVTLNLMIDRECAEHVVKTGGLHDNLIALTFGEVMLEKYRHAVCKSCGQEFSDLLPECPQCKSKEEPRFHWHSKLRGVILEFLEGRKQSDGDKSK